MSAAGIGTALVGFANGVMNNMFQTDAARQQKYENERNRQYNLQLAQMQNQWNIDQWKRENDYNNPINQRARLRAAGLNPDLVYGDGAQTLSAQSPAMTSGAGSNPSDVSALANRSSPLGQALSAEMMRAQIENIRADSAQKKSQTTGQDISNRYAELYSEQGLELQGAQIKFVGEQTDLTREQRREVSARIGEIEANTSLLQKKYDEAVSVIEQNKANTDFIKTQKHRMETLLDAEAKNLAAQTALSYAQAKSILEILPSQIGLMDAQGRLANSQANVLDEQYHQNVEYGRALQRLGVQSMEFQNGQLRLQLQSDTKFKDKERALQMIELVTRGFNNLLSSFTGSAGAIISTVK